MPPLFQFLTLLAFKIFICEQVIHRPLIPLKASHFGIRLIAAARSSFSPVFVFWFLACFFPYILHVVVMNLYTQNIEIQSSRWFSFMPAGWCFSSFGIGRSTVIVATDLRSSLHSLTS